MQELAMAKAVTIGTAKYLVLDYNPRYEINNQKRPATS